MSPDFTSSAFTAGPSQPRRTTKETHPNLPPGLVLDPDGKPCKVCNSWQDYAKMSVKKKKTPPQAPGSSSSSGGTTMAAGGLAGFASVLSGKSEASKPDPTERDTTGYSSATPQQLDRTDCPADTALLGRSTWTFLHTTAAYYPLRAPIRTQQNMLSLLDSLSLLYPCLPCQEDFREDVNRNPPDVSGREGLSRWLCERHNEVNEKLGKARFGCDWENLNKRWKDGPDDGRCD